MSQKPPTVAVRLLRIAYLPRRCHATALRMVRILAASTTVTTHLRLLTTHHLCHLWARLAHYLACLKRPSKSDRSTMSLPPDTWT
jgi:hypothetical protein